jgi:hypothetical protein
VIGETAATRNRDAGQAWAWLLASRARLWYGFLAVLCVGLGYGLTEAGIAFSGGTPSPPWLPIPAADYFKWEALFSAPVTLACWIIASGVIYLLSRWFGGAGSFEDTAALLGFAVALPTLISLIPDAVRATLTSFGALSRVAWEQAVSEPGTSEWLFLWSSMVAYLIGLLCLFTLAVATAQRLHRWPAALVGVVGAAVYQGLYFVFIR